MSKHTISRRGFVKAGVFAAAAAALGSSATGSLVETTPAYAAEGAPQRTAIRTACHGCIQCCPCIAYLEDGVVVKLEGDPKGPINKGSMCLKGMAAQHEVYSPRRILHPMKLVGQRGSNEWEVISWDEAITLAAEQYIACADKYGDYSFWCATGGGGGYSGPFVKLMQTALGSCNQISPGACQCYLPRKGIAQFMWGGDNQSIADHSCTEPFNEYCPTMELLVEWGAQPSTSQTAESGRGVADLRARGVKTIVIDPYFTADAAKADIWLPVRPGSDTALMLCWLRYIMDNELYNERFCKYWTNLPCLINPETKLPWEANEVWPDYVNPAEDPNGVYDTPAFVCFDAKTNSLQPLPFTAPDDCPVDPVLFTEVEVNGVMSKTAGQIYRDEADPWTLDHTAEICWLDAEKIEEAIKLYCSFEHAGIAHGVFSDMMECSSQASLGAIAIDMFMGHVNQPGCTLTGKGSRSVQKNRATAQLVANPGFNGMDMRYGVGWTIGYTKEANDKNLESKVAAWDAQGRDGKEMQRRFAQQTLDRLGMTKYKGAYYWMQSNIAAVGKAIDTGEPYKPRFLYETSGNKFVNLGAAGLWLDRFREQDFIVQQYTYMTSFTYECVDLFLPLEVWLEYSTGTQEVNQMNYNFVRKSVVHLGETAHNYIVPLKFIDKIIELRGGAPDAVFDRDVLVQGNNRCFNNMEEAEEFWATSMYKADSWSDLLERDEELNPSVTEDSKYWMYNQHENIAGDGLPVGFATMSRKCEPYCTLLLRMARTGFPFTYPFEQVACDDYSPICTYVEQEENALSGDTEYPLTLTSGRTHYWHHSTLRHMPFNRELMPEPEILINPDSAREYGVADGDWALVSSRRGSTHGVVRETEGIAPGVVWMERFWNPECFDSSQESPSGGWQECNLALLTIEHTANEVFGSASYRGFQVKIEKSTKPDRVWTEPKQFEPFMPTLQSEPVTEEAFRS